MSACMSEFSSTKAALFLGEKVLVYLRDDKPGLQYANTWDFPGGGREASETPIECQLRETDEEFGLVLAPNVFMYKRWYPSSSRPGAQSWFMVAHLNEALVDEIRFGDEGQRWELWTPEEILACDTFVPFLKDRFRDYLESRGIVPA